MTCLGVVMNTKIESIVFHTTLSKVAPSVQGTPIGSLATRVLSVRKVNSYE
jgi:hypothetical protein